LAPVVVVGPPESPVSELARYLREVGVAAVHVYVRGKSVIEGRSFGEAWADRAAERSTEASLRQISAIESRSVRDFTNEAPAEAGIGDDLSRDTDYVKAFSMASGRLSVVVAWESVVGVVAECVGSTGSCSVVVVGFSKRDVVAACATSEADYAVVWPKEKELLAAVVKAEASVFEAESDLGNSLFCVGVTSIKSSGATLLTANLAAQLTSMGRRVFLVDLDDSYKELTELVGGNDASSPRLKTTVGEVSGTNSVPTGAHWLYIAEEVVDAEGWASMRSLADAEASDVLLLDVPGRRLDPLLRQIEKRELAAPDAFFVVLSLDYFGVRQAHTVLHKIDALLQENKSAAVMLSFRGSGPRPDEIISLLGDRPTFELPWVPEEAGAAIDEGCLLAPSDRTAYGRAMVELAEWIVGFAGGRNTRFGCHLKELAEPERKGRLEWSRA